jgi:hypothetical protein
MAQYHFVTWHTHCEKPLDKDTQVRLLLAISAFPHRDWRWVHGSFQA